MGDGQGRKKGASQRRIEGRIEGFEEGREEGLERGIEQGRKEIQKNVVLEALHIRLDYGTIQKLTGFTLEEIKEIAAMAKA